MQDVALCGAKIAILGKDAQLKSSDLEDFVQRIASRDGYDAHSKTRLIECNVIVFLQQSCPHLAIQLSL